MLIRVFAKMANCTKHVRNFTYTLNTHPGWWLIAATLWWIASVPFVLAFYKQMMDTVTLDTYDAKIEAFAFGVLIGNAIITTFVWLFLMFKFKDGFSATAHVPLREVAAEAVRVTDDGSSAEQPQQSAPTVV